MPTQSGTTVNANAAKPLTLCTLALCLAACASPPGTLMGVVHEGGNFRPVPQARVVFTPVGDSGKAVTTELNYGGKFVVDLPAGEYQVSVEHPRFRVCESQPQPLVVLEGKSQRPQICLEPAAVAPPDATAQPAETSAEPAPTPPTPPPTKSAPNVSLPPAQATALSNAPERIPSPTQSLADTDAPGASDAAPLPSAPRLSDIPSQYPPAPPPTYAPASYRTGPIRD